MILADLFVFLITLTGAMCVLYGLLIRRLIPSSIFISTGVAIMLVAFLHLTPKSALIADAHAEAEVQSGVIQSLNYDQETKGILMVVDGEVLDINVDMDDEIKLVDNARNLYDYVKPEVGATIEYKQFEVDGKTYTDAIGYQPVVNITPGKGGG